MKQFGIIIGIFFAIAVLVIVVLPFFLGYSPGGPGTNDGSSDGPAPADRPKSSVGIFRSGNGGRDWEEKNTSEGDDIAKYQILHFAIHPFSSSVIFAGMKSGGLWRTENNGDSWQKIQDPNGALRGDSSVYRVIFNTNNPQEVYLAVFQQNRGRVLKSEDRGSSFREVYQTPVERFGVFDGFVDASGVLYIVTGQGGFFSSHDGGDSWRVVRWFRDGIVRLVVDPRNESRLFVFTEKGSIFRSEDKGGFWVDMTDALSQFEGALKYQKLLIDPADSTLYLASAYGLLTSIDGGNHWVAPSLIIPPEALPILAVARSPFDEQMLYLAASTQLYASSDRGISWSVISSPTGARIVDMVPDPQSRDVFFAVLAK
ncbi:MAG: hypothetical protein A3I44_04165 [Candidatus Sungbacteria bacterium RIFCSPLOWO2_02_FULL_51_17]|uniref:Sortilin N-terminal domain-containing protein n=1 Tax=Candidatus Sungbacteria bacterium RIFCSPHIGHO2_02_FULL_51_29 TaxID=1802273 RepID=A0A1G2KW85_9BACT|nr:MAG: hypothetical protein A2676_02680 [Candidatus Sungbacteria bacterium RIFCSPHIGHO2_01_FULL_51_22]OHA03705.1 MAG: hypothetical protein A3C16_03665 [Candidatus Sungbacteria bacterium RIFCSPHIGHO2_02_FULL_51_29]OHA07311.1 MAG: hypothetical protein A3B29_02770 [Candidatus Sungbacteria bacterium RIFCSPLOWO2_01_FULL_51_34]OHA11274.1 MAG: hypothetical protein A3I44_04165 [Candidatus Sungbacteria bacterium RIFCSPLOWO2_02_FULL_51_17]